MREELANLVHPVFSYGLNLKQRLESGERPDFDSEQMTLKGLLLSELEAKRFAEYGGQPDSPGMTRIGGSSRRSPDQFLGIRYSLACWLDEIFILDSPWEKEWNERKMEEALYGSNDRAWAFWEQARLAEARPGIDALEVFYLCVMLGFRGDLRDDATKLRAWADAAGARIAREQGKEWPMPPELEAPTNVPPLHGRDRLHRMVLVAAAAALLIIPIIVFAVVKQIGQ
jgi:type VI secretion system protein ImpK